MSSETAIWHDVEYGAYTADMPLWRELSSDASSVLELGCGTGRVAFDLARRGSDVVGVEKDLELAAEFELKAGGAGLEVEARLADLTSLDLGRRFDLVVGAMQLIQMLAAETRPAALEVIRRHLDPGGIAALAIVEPDSLTSPGAAPAVPDMREIDGWIYSSRPLWVSSDERELVIKRLRERVSPDGEVTKTVHEENLALLGAGELEREAGVAGLEPRERRSIDNGPSEADSTVVILEAV